MSATKDKKTGKWICQFRYKDSSGQSRKKFRRGFATKKDALSWEREFLLVSRRDPMMPFSSFTEIYLQDMAHRLRASTVQGKRYIIREKILPYFGNLPISRIRPCDVRSWEAALLRDAKANGAPYSPTYLKTIYNQLNAIFNYAVKYYELRENPCRKAGSIGSCQAGEMQFWTLDEFRQFLCALPAGTPTTLAFQVLYFTGMRVGELLALTRADFDPAARTIRINKSCQRSRKGDVVTPPKTARSIRTVSVPIFLAELLKRYTAALPPGDDVLLFPFHKYALTKLLEHTCSQLSLKRIRLHDLRHSHASLLIELGFPPLLIAERLGHEKVETTMNVYSHLYPGKQQEVAERLEILLSPQKLDQAERPFPHSPKNGCKTEATE